MKGLTDMTLAPPQDYAARHTFPDPEHILLDIALIYPSGANPRRRFPTEDLQDLADSIRLFGILEPLVVREIEGGYSIIAGERRFRAAKIAGLEKLPCMVRQCSERDALEMALTENLLRVDLDPIEEASGYQRLMETCNLNQTQIGDRLRRDQSTISHSLRLLKLPEDVQEQISEGILDVSDGKALAALADHPEQCRYFAQQATVNEWTTKKLQTYITDFLSSQRERDQPRLPETDAAKTEALQSFMGDDGAIRFPDRSTEDAEIPAPAPTPVMERPDTSNLLRSQATAPQQAQPAAAPTPIATTDTRSATAQPAATKPASKPAEEIQSGMVGCSIPAALDDWLWDIGLTPQTGLELLRRVETLAQIAGVTLQDYITSLEAQS